MNRKNIFDKANQEFSRSSGFDLMYEDAYISKQITLGRLISKNYQWLLDHANDVERGLIAHMKTELNGEE